jgi:site-specific DNA recombinase
MVTQQPTAAGIYCRISYDPKGDRLGVDRQEPPCRDLCARKGWTVAEVYTDDDISAYQPKHRPAYQQLLADAAAGRIQAIVAWHPDRLTRQPIENEGLIDLADRYGTLLATAQAGDQDLSTPDGRMTFRIMGAIARRESEHKAERRKLMLAQRAAGGLPNFGGQRAFGYAPGGMELDPDEAKLIREAVERLLRKRETVYAVLADWRTRDIHSPGTHKHPDGNPWTTTPFRDMLCSPRLAGLRQHQGEVIGPAAWPAIITPAERDQLRGLFARNPRRPGRPPTRLLVGLVFCGRPGCGRHLVSCWPSDNRGLWAYGCKQGIGQDGCARTYIDGRQTDLLIVERVIDKLIGQGLANAVKTVVQGSADDAALAQQIEDDDRALAELAHARFVERSIEHRHYLQARGELEQRQAEARRLMGRHASAAALLDLPRTEAALRRWWASPTTTLERKRAVLRAVLARVEVRPRAMRRSQFEPGRVVIPDGGWKL